MMEKEETNQRLKHVNSVLKAIRNVNQLIVHTKDKAQLLQGSCDILTETRGYFNAWIALLDDDRKLIESYESGLGDHFGSMVNVLEAGDFPSCIRRVLNGEPVVVMENPPENCIGCPLGSSYKGRGGITASLIYENRSYGVLVLSVPEEYVNNSEERELIAEIAGDLAFALQSLEMWNGFTQEAQRNKNILNSINDAFFALTDELVVTYFNRAAEELLGRSQDEVIGKTLFDAFPEARGSEFETRYKGAIDSRKVDNFEVYFDVAPYANWYDVRVFPQPEGGISVYFNVTTTHKNALLKLSKSEELLRTTVKSIGDAVISTDLEARVLSMNPVAETLTGWSEKEAIGQPLESVFRIINEKTRKKVDNPVMKTLKSGIIVGLANHTLLIDKDNREIPIADSSAPIRNDNGEISGVVLVFRDQTEERAANIQIQESRNFLDTLLDQSPFPMWIGDAEGTLIRTNQALRDALKLTNEQLVGHYNPLRDPNMEREGLTNTIRAVIEQHRPARFTMLWRPVEYGNEAFETGQDRYIDLAMYPIVSQGKLQNIVTQWQDISEQKQIEESLRESERRLALATSAAGIGTWVWDIATDEMFWDERIFQLYGISEIPEHYGLEYWQNCLIPEDRSYAAEACMAAIRGEKDYDIEFRVQWPDGTIRWMKADGLIVYDEEKKPVRMLGTNYDITERRTNEARLRTILNKSPFPVAVVDPKDEIVIYWSQSAREKFGHKPTRVSQWYESAYPDPLYREHVINRWRPFVKKAALSDEPVNAGEYQITCKDGSIVICELFVQFIPDHMIVTFNDITEKKGIQQELTQFAWLLEKESGASSVSITPEYGDIIKLNRGGLLLNTIGWEQLNEMCSDVMDLLDSCVAIYEKNGDYAYANFVSSWCGTMDNASRRLCNTEDNREALSCGKWLCHDSCWKISKAALDSGNAVDHKCVGGLSIYAVPIICRGEPIGIINFGYGVPPSDPDQLVELSHTYQIDLDRLQHNVENYKPRPPFIVEMAKKRLNSIAQRIGEIVAVKQSEQQLKVMETRNQALLDYSPLCHKIIDLDLNLQFMNRSGFRMLNLEETEDLYGKPYPFDFFPDQSRQDLIRSIREVIETGDRVELETLACDSLGKEAWLHHTILPVKQDDHTIEYLTVVTADITEQKRMQERIQHSEKMDAIGQLAGGVAHDFNNQLTGILGFAELLVQQLDEPELKTYAENICTAGMRSKDLTMKLLAFSRKGKFRRVPVDVHILINEVIAILLHSIDKRIQIKQELNAHKTSICGDPSLIQNALLNICINARDAMPEGGSLAISTEVLEMDETTATAQGIDIEAGSYIEISVSDTGSGIPKNILPRIFEPFYTTKSKGKGTGMGLSAAYGAAKAHQGDILVQSKAGEGTCVKMILPAESCEVDKPDKKNQRENEKASKSLNILVVDDEELIRTLERNLLINAGHTVHCVSDGQEAIDFYREEWKHIDLVILDMIMPKITGKDVFNAIRRINPVVKVILVSGYSIDKDSQGLLTEGAFGFVQKPFSKEKLMSEIRRAFPE